MNILSIESSCDETAAAVVRDGCVRVADTVASSKDLHEITGGVVPEVAARKQIESIAPIIEQTLEKYYGGSFPDKVRVGEGIDAVAVTVGPGLIGSLIVGIEAAKSLSMLWRKPLIPVNHLVGHIYANFISRDPEEIKFPAVALLVSGGHTDLIYMKGHMDFQYLGGTLDDAAGEAFDKTARLLGISKYLGGVLLSKKAAECEKNIYQGVMPRPMINDDSFDFSFSGLKTAVKRFVEKEGSALDVSSLACEFENAVVDVLLEKTVRAVKKYEAKSLLVGGGVSANKQLRSRLEIEAEKNNFKLFIPPIDLCTDNAVYIAGAAYFMTKVQKENRPQKNYSIYSPEIWQNIKPNPSLGIMDNT